MLHFLTAKKLLLPADKSCPCVDLSDNIRPSCELRALPLRQLNGEQLQTADVYENKFPVKSCPCIDVTENKYSLKRIIQEIFTTITNTRFYQT